MDITPILIGFGLGLLWHISNQLHRIDNAISSYFVLRGYERGKWGHVVNSLPPLTLTERLEIETKGFSCRAASDA